jgi:hypothetical protein
VTIHEVDTTKRRDVNRFINVPFRLYEGCPQWVPPIMPDARLQLNRKKNPYYKRNDAAFFLAVRDGKDVGRICVMHPRFYNEFKGTNQAFFYLFDCIDDQETANALFDTAAGWASARGLALFRGPLGFMAADGFGMLAKGFEHRPAVGIPYNYPYYTKLAETWGFELEERVYSGYVDVARLRREFPMEIVRMGEQIKQRYGFTVKTFKNKRELRTWAAPRLADLYNRTLTHIAGDPPLSDEEVAVVADNLLMISDPKMLKFVMKGEEIIGFLFCFVDISEGIQRAKGRIFPFGWYHILRDFGRTTWLDLNGMGVIPEYQGKGAPALMYGELYSIMDEFPRFEHGDAVQISEFNAKSLNEMKRFGVEFYKTHHIYRKALE